MDIKDFKNRLFEAAAAAGLEEYELYCKRSDSFSTKTFEGEVDELKSQKTFGACFRGKVGGKMGYAFSEKIDGSVIDFLVRSVRESAEIIEDPEEEFIYQGDAEYPEVLCFNADLSQVEAQEKIDAGLAIESAAKNFDERVQNLPYCMLADYASEVFIANSKGMDVSSKSNGFFSYAYAQVAEGEDVKTGGDGITSLDFAAFCPKEFGERSAEIALANLGASPVPTGKYAIVLDPGPAGEMLSVWIEAFSAEKAQKGFSLLAGKLDTKIAADCVTLVDDPLMPAQAATTPFDSEGVASKTKTVIDGGIFKTFLHNTKSAKKDGVSPTGNGFKWSVESPVDICATNFFIKPSETTREQLLAQMGDGLLITEVEGLHAGANETSGDFSVLATGFEIKNGQKGRPVEQITISGNFFEMLNQIEAVASNLEFKSGMSVNNAAAPSVYVSSLDVAGE